MDDLERTNNPGLLDVLQAGVACPYLSNLRDPVWSEALMSVVGGIDAENYSTQVWRNASEYITGFPCMESSQQAAKDQLLVFLFSRRPML